VSVCPTSSDETGGWSYEKKQWHKHPCVTMKAKGVSFSFSSDDPAVFHTSLAWQFRVALARMELTKEDLLKANLEAINAAFCSDEVKEHMRKELCAYGREKLTYERIDNARVPTKKQTHPYRRAMSEGFVDRVHLTKSQYF
jgi:adenosine deaminase